VLKDEGLCVATQALRLIKYALPRTTTEFRREIQRYSTNMKNLFHFRGPPDPLKGDAPSKAVRDAAHEAVQALFNPEAPQGRMAKGGAAGGGGVGGYGDGTGKRMEGFGNTALPRQAGGSAGSSGAAGGLGNMIGFGSEAIQQGLSMFSGAGSGATREAQPVLWFGL